jgi:hypothetical protein
MHFPFRKGNILFSVLLTLLTGGSSGMRPVRLAYQPPVSISEQTSHQQAVLFSQKRPAPAIRHQPTEQAVILIRSLGFD